jgi:hypothetical protein
MCCLFRSYQMWGYFLFSEVLLLGTEHQEHQASRWGTFGGGHSPKSPPVEGSVEMEKALEHHCSRANHLVRLAGIEPTTPWFVAKYSIQLSYSRIMH